MLDITHFNVKTTPKREDLDKQLINFKTTALGINKKWHHIYAIIDQIYGKIYIGKHSCNTQAFLDTSYFGSGVAISQRIKLIGKEKLTRVSLVSYDNLEDCLRAERYFVDYEQVSSTKWYNLVIGGGFSETPYQHFLIENDIHSPVAIEETTVDFNNIYLTHTRILKDGYKLIWATNDFYWKHKKYFDSINSRLHFENEVSEKLLKARKFEICQICNKKYPKSMFKKHFTNSICHDDVYESIVEAVGLPPANSKKLKLMFNNIILRETKTHIDWYNHGFFAPEGNLVRYELSTLIPIPYLEPQEHEVIRQVILTRRARRELLQLSNYTSAININYSL